MTGSEWPPELHTTTRGRRGQPPSRDVSPVPSYCSEPTCPRPQDVFRRVASVCQEDEGEEEEVLSLKSLPCARKPTTNRHKARKPQRYHSRQMTTLESSALKLPPITEPKEGHRCGLMVRGSGCVKACRLPPMASGRSKSTLPERPPCRAGRRPDKEAPASAPSNIVASPTQTDPSSETNHASLACGRKADLHALTSNMALVSASAGHSHLLQRVYIIIPTHPPQRTADKAVPRGPVRRRWPTFRRGALECVWEEGCVPPSPLPNLMEPISGFREQLQRQLLCPTLPYRGDPKDASHPDAVPAAHKSSVTI
ncbi:uncharacterized protein LOC114764987 [Denticeps clupeoides]|uniref:uncharacterized protein LOC114764987 n=1 Tax=Denticeps clupeoides TaxID=299321 RepID=UPI0010A4FECB|nr:uncharacterized protein LOC114764987 [Denticeps clupeoides]